MCHDLLRLSLCSSDLYIYKSSPRPSQHLGLPLCLHSLPLLLASVPLGPPNTTYSLGRLSATYLYSFSLLASAAQCPLQITGHKSHLLFYVITRTDPAPSSASSGALILALLGVKLSLLHFPLTRALTRPAFPFVPTNFHKSTTGAARLLAFLFCLFL